MAKHHSPLIQTLIAQGFIKEGSEGFEFTPVNTISRADMSKRANVSQSQKAKPRNHWLFGLLVRQFGGLDV